jgi:hypothetical protein
MQRCRGDGGHHTRGRRRRLYDGHLDPRFRHWDQQHRRDGQQRPGADGHGRRRLRRCGGRFASLRSARGLPCRRHPLVSSTMKQKKETERGSVGTPYLEKIFIQLLFIHGPLQAGVVGWLSLSYRTKCCLSCSIFFLFLQELVLEAFFVLFCFVISM